ncbi:hypothetical protein F0L68_40235 [Solihabitans fulvus]|uniref:Uncharacterized protein n=1 Tax=Solihabitans fulvus TaxID=1892852 RepID=A0A5B2W992_9PSEU|nr:hypothetical protein [Solihabitans fulvus]KAA2247310.1 hypothetical protein F0L68_40235 [Solihabitans fulvus]
MNADDGSDDGRDTFTGKWLPLTILLVLVVGWILLILTLPKATPLVITADVSCRSGVDVASVWIEAARGGSGWATAVKKDGGTTRYTYKLPFAGGYEVRAGCGGTSDNWSAPTSSRADDAVYRRLLCDDPAYRAPNPAPCVDLPTR